MNPGAVLHFLGRLMALIGVAMLAPFFCALVFGEFQAAGVKISCVSLSVLPEVKVPSVLSEIPKSLLTG